MIKLNLGCGGNPIHGFVNMDIKPAPEELLSQGYAMMEKWRFQDGLPMYKDKEVDGITISHALYWLYEFEYEPFLRECFRVLKNGGVIRIVDENNDAPTEIKRKYVIPYKPDVNSRISRSLVRKYLQNVGFVVYDVDEKVTHFKDRTLMQNIHSWKLPGLFFIEGIKYEDTSDRGSS